ncbi:MAG: hypothetical protein FWD73_08180 [Polyangiaceae bacterium]|nr:hypothetical protein [Polyangiaceae bacterium]
MTRFDFSFSLLMAAVLCASVACSTRIEKAEQATATVLGTSDGKCSWFPDSGDLCPRIEAEVHRDGGAPYRVTFEARLPIMQAVRIQPGVRLRVMVDVNAPQHVALATEPFFPTGP